MSQDDDRLADLAQETLECRLCKVAPGQPCKTTSGKHYRGGYAHAPRMTPFRTAWRMGFNAAKRLYERGSE